VYAWTYVEKLQSMLDRYLGANHTLHVFTEPERCVPGSMIKHALEPWPNVHGAKKSWWHKLKLFDPGSGIRQMLYFDLDVIIARDISWILQLDTAHFWTIRDFRYLWKPQFQGINSSMMYWNVQKFASVWQEFQQRRTEIMHRYRGDQDFLTDAICTTDIKFFDPKRVASWRWQIWEGGIDFRTRRSRAPGSGVDATGITSDILVFHGRPKPHEIAHEFVSQHWR
jgi:hypothetical protein